MIPETPVRVEYRLTARGEALGTVLDAVGAWAETWLSEDDVRPEDRQAADACQEVVSPRRTGRRRAPRSA